MATTPRINSATPGEEATLGNVLAHAPDVISRFGELYATLWQTGELPADLREMTRLRNARVTGCGYWRNVRFDSAREAGLTEERIDQVCDNYQALVSEREALALMLTDALIGDPDSLNKDQCQALVAEFDAGDRAELALGVCLFFGLSKVMVALGLEPESMPTTVLPTPGSVAAG